MALGVMKAWLNLVFLWNRSINVFNSSSKTEVNNIARDDLFRFVRRRTKFSKMHREIQHAPVDRSPLPPTYTLCAATPRRLRRADEHWWSRLRGGAFVLWTPTCLDLLTVSRISKDTCWYVSAFNCYLILSYTPRCLLLSITVHLRYKFAR